MQKTDIIIVGGGIVGLATAYRLVQTYPGKRIVILEKEAELAHHQTGHNSGVLHSGIYYRPGSLRAQNCRTGKLAMEEFCREHEVPFDLCGKVIVAIDEAEIVRLESILERGQQNGVACEMIDRNRLLEIEPHSAGIQAIHVPEAGIVDYRQVCNRLAEIVRNAGGTVTCDARVTSIQQSNGKVVVVSTAGDFEATCLVNCTGLHSDRTTKLGGIRPENKIVPFRGEFFELKPEVHHFVRGLIYPVPDPRFPFLGVHFTRVIHGGVECGPNAVLAFAREGYRKTDINLRDLAESLTYPGFLRMALKYWKTGLGEMWRSVSKRAFVKALQRLVPEIRSEHLVTAPSGVRAQLLGRDGSIVDDFVIQENDRIVNVCNAPSPAATASLNVGTLVVERLASRLT
ncbi:MAG: L-2-hydroxyglutarate oxidase [Planctomycetota bacterium]|nr:L-2-hydroxyglutarate oxidase [Planctomycetota bacterium]